MGVYEHTCPNNTWFASCIPSSAHISTSTSAFLYVNGKTESVLDVTRGHRPPGVSERRREEHILLCNSQFVFECVAEGLGGGCPSFPLESKSWMLIDDLCTVLLTRSGLYECSCHSGYLLGTRKRHLTFEIHQYRHRTTKTTSVIGISHSQSHLEWNGFNSATFKQWSQPEWGAQWCPVSAAGTCHDRKIKTELPLAIRVS